MCLQCMTKAKMLIKDVLPGYFLMKATVHHNDWPKGYYALVQCNDPDFIWEGKPLLDPLFNISDKKLDLLSNKNPLWKKSDKFFEYIEKIESKFITDPIQGYELIEACIKAGYDMEKHGKRPLCWLSHHMALKLKKIQIKNKRIKNVKIKNKSKRH